MCVCGFFFSPFKSLVFMNESSVEEAAESRAHSALTHPPSAEQSREGGVLAEDGGQSLKLLCLPQKEEEEGISQESSEEEQ